MKPTVIAGAGVIGLTTALELAARGRRVIVLERGRALEEASWAAAGMLAAADPENPAALAPLSRFSLSLYPDFLERLQRLSGIDVPLRTFHTLQLCDPDGSSDHVTAMARRLSAEEASERIPGLNIHSAQIAVWLKEQSLDPRELGTALASACEAVGIEIRERTEFLSAADEDGQLAISTSQGMLEAETLVVATGAWSAQSGAGLASLPEAAILPRKGQMLRLRFPEKDGLATVLRTPEIYIVPRGDGRLIVGATVEDAGFDRTIRQEATTWLLERAVQLWTPIGSVKPENIEEVWTGIRPGTPDSLPILGRLNHPRVFFATGHYRNGILLAPGTARVITQLICDEALDVDLTPYHPGRLIRRDYELVRENATAVVI